MTPLDLASWAQQTAGGSMTLAIPVAMFAGLVSFFSPCCVPLLPGYLAYATGLSAADITNGTTGRLRMLLGTSLFVLGFALVFVSAGIIVGAIGNALITYQDLISRIVGGLIIVMGLAFAGWLPIGRREVRLKHLPTVGIAGAPILGIVFGLGWTPCLGPTLSVVINLALNEGTASRGGFLAFVYALGLGLPFILAGLGLNQMTRTIDIIKRHQQALLRVGGLLMVAVGLMLISGLWDRLMGILRQWASQFGTII